MNIESFLDTDAGALTIFNWKTKEMILGENGEILKFRTNNEACNYCGDHGLNCYLVDQIEPKLRSLLFGKNNV